EQRCGHCDDREPHEPARQCIALLLLHLLEHQPERVELRLAEPGLRAGVLAQRARTQLAEEVGALPEDARVRRLRKPHHRLVRVVETLYTLECGAEALAVAPHATELAPLPEDDDPAHERSEEHTSELQSRENLV